MTLSNNELSSSCIDSIYAPKFPPFMHGIFAEVAVFLDEKGLPSKKEKRLSRQVLISYHAYIRKIAERADKIAAKLCRNHICGENKLKMQSFKEFVEHAIAQSHQIQSPNVVFSLTHSSCHI